MKDRINFYFIFPTSIVILRKSFKNSHSELKENNNVLLGYFLLVGPPIERNRQLWEMAGLPCIFTFHSEDCDSVEHDYHQFRRSGNWLVESNTPLWFNQWVSPIPLLINDTTINTRSKDYQHKYSRSFIFKQFSTHCRFQTTFDFLLKLTRRRWRDYWRIVHHWVQTIPLYMTTPTRSSVRYAHLSFKLSCKGDVYVRGEF